MYTRKSKRKYGGRSGKTAKFFPYKKGVKYSELAMTPEGVYSTTQRDDGKVLMQHMRSVLGPTGKLTITDATANVGGDTILFGMHFKHVESIEIKDDNFEALEKNVAAFGLKNVTLHKGDSTQIYDWHTDVLYIDAPWGGTDYKKQKDIDLYLGDVRLDTFLDHVLSKEWNPDHVFLKVPRNFNFARLDKYAPKKFQIRGFNLLYLHAY